MSWKGQGIWGKDSSWGFGYGKGGKKSGKKGKGKTPSHQAEYYDAGEAEWEEAAPGAAAEQHLYRIKNRYHVAHAILKTACDQEGSAFAKQHKTNDFAFLGSKCMKALLTRDNHHLLRRPGVGLSEAAGSLQAGADVLKNLMDLDITVLQTVLGEEEVAKALRVLNTLDSDPTVERAPKALQAAVSTLAERLTAEKGLEAAAIKVTIMASRLYLFGMQLLPLLHGFSDPSWWAEAIPETGNKALRAWQASSQSRSKMAKALASMVTEKLESASGPSANDAAALFGRTSKKAEGEATSEESKKKPKKRKAVSTSSSEREKQDKKKKKDRKRRSSSASSTGDKKKRKDKKDKKEKKSKDEHKEEGGRKKAKKSSSPSHASSSRARKSPPRATTSEVKIRCINAVDADGHGIVKETDHVDTVEVTKKETLQQVLERFLQAEGKGEDIKNWNIKLLTEGVLRSVDASATPAHSRGEAALVRKGG